MTPERSAPQRVPVRRGVGALGMALVGALVMGAVVFAINAGHGPRAALIAALKQGAYTLCLGSVIIGLCRRLSVARVAPAAALALATLVPAGLSCSLTLFVHLLRGTPEPLRSTLPTLLIVPPSCLAIAALHRRRTAQVKNPGGQVGPLGIGT